MRINVYSQELLLDDLSELFEKGLHTTELETKRSNTEVSYSAVRLFLHSSERLHHPPVDDDRSAITFWLPKSQERRERFARQLEDLATKVREAPLETGLD